MAFGHCYTFTNTMFSNVPENLLFSCHHASYKRIKINPKFRYTFEILNRNFLTNRKFFDILVDTINLMCCLGAASALIVSEVCFEEITGRTV